MPYSVKKRGKKWVVTKSEDDRVLGTHDSETGAEMQRRAILAHEKMRKK